MTEDKVGVLEQIIHLIVEEGYNIANTVNIPTKDDHVVIEVQIDGITDTEVIKKKFEEMVFVWMKLVAHLQKPFK